MTNCTKYEELISSAIDKELSFAEEAELLDHIAQCPSCKKVYETYKEVFSSFEDVMEEPPVELKNNIMSAIKDSGAVYTPTTKTAPLKAKKSKKNAWVKFAAIAACFVLIVASVPSLFGGRKSAAPESTAGSDAANRFDVLADAPAADMPAADMPVADAAPDTSVSDNLFDMTEDGTESDMIIAPEKPDYDMPSEEPAGEPTTETINACTIYVSGALPEILEDYNMLENGDGSYRIYIAPDTAQALLTDGIWETKHSAPDLPVSQYIVIYTP